MRKAKFNDVWYYAVEDLVRDSVTGEPTAFIKELRKRNPDLLDMWPRITVLLPLEGNQGLVECATKENIEVIKGFLPKPVKEGELSEFNKRLDQALKFNPKK